MTAEERDAVIDECIQTVLTLATDSDLTLVARAASQDTVLAACFRLRMMQAQHADERAYLVSRRWPNGVTCPTCGRAKLPASWRAAYGETR